MYGISNSSKGRHCLKRVAKYIHDKPVKNKCQLFTFNSIPSVTIKVVGFTSIFIGASLFFSMTERSNRLIKSDSAPLITAEEVERHKTLDDCWVAIHGKVYDVSRFLESHPGGASKILKYAGSDATKAFSQIHSSDVIGKTLLEEDYLGDLSGEFKEVPLDKYESELARKAEHKPPMSKVFNLSDFEFIAKNTLAQLTYTYFATGASDEYSVRENHYAYSRLFFRPRCCHNVTQVSSTCELMGCKSELPVYITAFAGSAFGHPDGELALMRAAYKEGIIQMVPKINSVLFDDFYNATNNEQDQWCQFHFDSDEEINKAQSIFRRFEKVRSIKGIFINVDLTDLGNREKDMKVRSENDDSASEDLNAKIDYSKSHFASSLTWDHISKFVEMTYLPIALKGIQRGEDVVKAAELGIKAVVISNHGGRQLDFSRPPIEVLAEARALLKKKGLEDSIELYVDGGIRRGSDVIKALCLGAKGVGLGRPFLYALSAYGEEGVSHAIRILKKEIVNNMKLLGVSRLDQLNESFICERQPIASDSLYDAVYQDMTFPSFRES